MGRGGGGGSGGDDDDERVDGVAMVEMRDAIEERRHDGGYSLAQLERKSSFDSTEGETASWLDGDNDGHGAGGYGDGGMSRQDRIDLCCDDVCGDFEWWSLGAWVGWAIRLFVEVSGYR